MHRKRLLSVLALASASALLLASATQANAAAVWSVITVRVEGDATQWLELVKQASAIRKRLEIPTVNVVQATFAGDATGLFYVSTEYPSLAALGEASDKLTGDASFQAVLKQLQTLGTVESSSLYVDRTPAGVKSTPITPGGYATGLTVRAGGDPAAYLALLPRLTANFARLGVSVPRIWQATSAGAGTGAILITTAQSSLAAMEEAQKKIDADAEVQALFREFEATGRHVVARIIVRDRTPY
jgi:hypothetical protein